MKSIFNTHTNFIKTISTILIILLLLGMIVPFLNTNVQASYSSAFSKYPGYEELIKKLQTAHPNWEFEILETGLDWSETIIAESTESHGKNVVPKSSSSPWICNCKKIVESSWICASTAAVAYYMDPRNSLNEDYIFQFEQLTYDSTIQTRQGVETILSPCDYMQGKITYYDANGQKQTINKTYIDVIMEAAKEYNISPYHLASRIRQEQGTGSAGGMIDGKYTGYKGLYNYFNIGAYGSNVMTAGLTYAKNSGWTNPEKAIKGGAKVLANNYIAYGQDTLYLQKFDVVDGGDGYYVYQYMTNVSASKTEGNSIRNAYYDMGLLNNTSKIKFKIPVYKNMPQSRAPMPGSETIVTQDVQINGDSVNIRQEKSKKSTSITTLNKGAKLLRIELDNGKDAEGIYWDKVVLSNGNKGYVSRQYLTQISLQTNCNEQYVVSDYTNFRNGPGTTGTTIIQVLSPGQIVTVIEKDKYKSLNGESWYRIQIADGTYGYIGSEYIEKYDPTKIERVKVACSSGLYIRQEPSTSSAIINAVAKGTILTRMDKNVSSTDTKYIWDKVTTSGGRVGYVARQDPTTKELWIVPVTQTNNTIEIKGTGFKTSNTNIICQPNITVANIKKVSSNIVIKNGTTTVSDSAKVGTGYTVTLDGKTYTIIVRGDVNGDAQVGALDYVRIKNYMLSKATLTSAQKIAADANNDNQVGALDYVRIKNYMLNKASISI